PPEGAARQRHDGRRSRPRRDADTAGPGRRVPAVRSPDRPRWWQAVLPAPGRPARPPTRRNAEVRRRCPLPPLRARRYVSAARPRPGGGRGVGHVRPPPPLRARRLPPPLPAPPGGGGRAPPRPARRRPPPPPRAPLAPPLDLGRDVDRRVVAEDGAAGRDHA